MPVLQTPRLALREMEAGDAPFIVEQLTDPSFLANIGDRGVHDLDSAQPYIARWQAAYARDGYGHVAARCWSEDGQLLAISRQTVTVFG